jgi:hypothetical protein
MCNNRSGRPSKGRTIAALAEKLSARTTGQAGFNTRLDPRKMFSLSGRILRDVREPSDRELLSRRLGEFLSRKRRGKLRLPRRFPESVHALSYLTRGQIRRMAYWVNPSMSASCTVDHRTARIMHCLAGSMIWTRVTDPVPSGHEAVVRRLPSKLAPRSTREVWPSAPDLFEITAQSRSGRIALLQDNLPLKVNNCLTRKAVSDDIRLATRIVRQQIVGIRTGMGVPEKFLGYFRRRHGFLILSTRYNLPSGLVRFLLAKWIVVPTSLWLVEPCPFRTFLRRRRATDFVRDALVAAPVSDQASEERVGSPNTNSYLSYKSLYVPPLTQYQEILILNEIQAQGLFPSSQRRKGGPPSAVR